VCNDITQRSGPVGCWSAAYCRGLLLGGCSCRRRQERKTRIGCSAMRNHNRRMPCESFDMAEHVSRGPHHFACPCGRPQRVPLPSRSQCAPQPQPQHSPAQARRIVMHLLSGKKRFRGLVSRKAASCTKHSRARTSAMILFQGKKHCPALIRRQKAMPCTSSQTNACAYSGSRSTTMCLFPGKNYFTMSSF
jgi:hypothetical protein